MSYEKKEMKKLKVQYGWIGMVLAFILLLLHVQETYAGDLWLEVNGLSYHTESDYHDGYEKRYGSLYELQGPGCCRSDDGKTLYVLEEKRESYNAYNYGLGAMYELDDHIAVKGGFYNNSYSKTSVYGGVNVRWEIPVGKLKVVPNTTVGFVTGYDDTPVEASKYQLTALPAVGIGTDNVRLNVGYIPSKMVFGDEYADVITAQLQLKVR